MPLDIVLISLPGYHSIECPGAQATQNYPIVNHSCCQRQQVTQDAKLAVMDCQRHQTVFASLSVKITERKDIFMDPLSQDFFDREHIFV